MAPRGSATHRSRDLWGRGGSGPAKPPWDKGCCRTETGNPDQASKVFPFHVQLGGRGGGVPLSRHRPLDLQWGTGPATRPGPIRSLVFCARESSGVVPTPLLSFSVLLYTLADPFPFEPHHPGSLALWVPVRFGQWEAQADGRWVEREVYPHLSPSLGTSVLAGAASPRTVLWLSSRE